MSNINQTQAKPIDRLKAALNTESVQTQFNNALKENSQLFTASLIDLCSGDTMLQNCEPKLLIAEALKAATLKLPINKSLGFAYIVAYKNKGVPTPTFILGYKGYIQLAMRTGFYRYINADAVYEGEFVCKDKLTGEVDLSGAKTSDKIIGYFAHFELLNGFKKTLYWTKEEIIAHAKKFSKSYSNDKMPWQTEFGEMAKKTVLRNLISKYGYLSVDMIASFEADSDTENKVAQEIDNNANQQTIDIKLEDVSDDFTDDVQEAEAVAPIPSPGF